MTNFFKSYFGLVIVLVLSLWAIQPFFTPGFFPMHDDTQVVRVYEMTQSLRDGHFPVRWVKDLGYGYGYPLFNFYAPLPYYIGGFLHIVGFDVLTSTEIMMALGVLFSGVFMYLLAREFWGEVGGIVSGLFYMYAPYHAVQVYVRGSVGEYFALAFIPLVFYGLWKAGPDLRWKWVVIGALGFAGIIISHNLTAFTITPFIVFTLLWWTFTNSKNNILRYMITLALGLGLSAFYWIPAVSEMGYTNVTSQIGGGADFRNHFVCITQLWDSPWGFGGSAPGCLDGLSFKIGKLHIIGAVLALLVGLYFWKRETTRSRIIVFFSAVSLVSVFMMLQASEAIWEAVPALAFIQYPWRFLVVATFASSLLLGSVIWFAKNQSKQYTIAVICITLLLILNGRLFAPQTNTSLTAEEYTDESYIKWTTSKISDEYMPENFNKPKSSEEIPERRVDIVRGEGLITSITDKTQTFLFEVDARTELEARINIAPFPSWKVFVDDQQIQYEERNDGIGVKIPIGVHAIEAKFTQTFSQGLGNILSIGSILALFGIMPSRNPRLKGVVKSLKMHFRGPRL